MPVKISDTIAEEAIATLRALSCKETAAGETDLRWERAATSLLRLYQTQERYGLNPQAPADYARATRRPNSGAQQLETTTEDDLYALQAQLAGDYPGKRH
jgi:hypothetical protein